MSNFTNRTVSNRYLTINTDDLIRSALGNLGNTHYQLRTLKTNAKKNTMERIEVKFPEYSYMDPTGSEVIPMAVITNSYNGECSLQVDTGFWRKICANGMLGIADRASIGRIIHLKSNLEQVKQLEYAIVAFLKSVNEQKRFLEQLASTPVANDRVLSIISQLEYSKLTTDRIMQAWKNPREEDSGDNLYCLWNIVNEQLRKTGRSESAQVKKNIGLIDQLIKLAA